MSDKTVNAKADISPKSSLKQALYTKAVLYNIPSSDLHTNPAQTLDLQYSDSKKKLLKQTLTKSQTQVRSYDIKNKGFSPIAEFTSQVYHIEHTQGTGKKNAGS